MWPRFGFRANPYSQETLSPNESGNELLAGRDQEIASLQRHIGSGGAHASVEGPIGAGKTSMINVAVYRMAKMCMEAKRKELYLPATAALQPRENVDTFVDELFRVLAQTLIQHRGSFAAVGLQEPEVAEVDKWLNNAQYESWSGGAQVLGFGGDAGGGSEPNTSDGYSRTGFETFVRKELARVFAGGTGGIVCILDNLEILKTSGEAKLVLDELRDRVFNIPGVRWVLCGSRGIVSRARTERLSGIIQAPLVMKALDQESAVDAIRRRIKYYGNHTAEAPVTPEGFEFLYSAMHQNLRDSMERAQTFSAWIVETVLDENKDLPSPDDRDELLKIWLLEQAEAAYQDARGIQPRVWQFFVQLGRGGGRAGSSESLEYDFANQQQMTSSVTALQEANLVSRELDPENGSRTINSITALGWLVYFYAGHFEAIPKDSIAAD